MEKKLMSIKKNKISYKPAEGLRQNLSGFGVVGLQGIVFSSQTTIPVTNSTTTTMEIHLPANALILDAGLVTIEAIDCDSGSKVTVSFGSESGGAQYVAATQINQTNTDVAAGTMVSVGHTNLVHASGTALPTFANAAPLYAAANRTVYANVAISGATLSAAGSVRAFVKYTIVEDTY